MRALVIVACAALACSSDKKPEPAKALQTINVAVIGGMLETGFWQEIATRFESKTGHKVKLAASGPKPVVIEAFRKGGIDLITLHASDAIVNLVVDGLAVDPQPWAQNDMVIVGPTSDPAKIKGERDAAEALKKLAAAKVPVLVHASLGADGVLHDLENAADTKLPGESVRAFDGENQHQILAKAAEIGAYTFVGRIPMLTGKLRHDGIEIMVRGDGRLRRPYMVTTAKNAPDAARELADFLRAPETQEFIATYGKGTYDDASLFFPVSVN